MALFFVVFCVPETQGLSLEEIETLYTGVPMREAREDLSQIAKSQSYRRVSSIANLKPTPSIIL